MLTAVENVVQVVIHRTENKIIVVGKKKESVSADSFLHDFPFFRTTNDKSCISY